MATTRFGHLDDFTLKNSKVGIGTSTPTEALEVIGGSRSKDIAVTGIATLTSYEGFQNTKFTTTENKNITGGESGTLSGEVVIGAGLTMSVGTGATTGQGSVKSLKVSNTFTPPIGGTNDRPLAPQPGTIYYNKDFRTIEYWDGNFWRQVDNTTRRGRGIIFGGFEPGIGHVMIQQFEVSTLGNTSSFGDLIESTYSNGGGCSSETRGLTGGSGPGSNTIQYITIASSGDSIDFGDLSVGRGYSSGTSSSTRGIWVAGATPSANTNTIDYAEISTLGNAADFGDISSLTNDVGTCASPTRGIVAGGAAGRDVIEYVTFASKGNATDFGTMKRQSEYSGHSNTVRGIFMSRHNGSESVTLATGGNAQYFADLRINARLECATTGNMTRCVIGGGYTPAHTNSMEYVTISTEGSAADFGDMMSAVASTPTCSDSHGGLGGF